MTGIRPHICSNNKLRSMIHNNMSNHVKWQSSIGVSNVWAPKVLSVRTCPPKIPAHIDWIDWWWIAATVLAFRLGSLLEGSEKTNIKHSYIAFEFVIIHQIMLSWLDLSIQHKQTFPSWIAATNYHRSWCKTWGKSISCQLRCRMDGMGHVHS